MRAKEEVAVRADHTAGTWGNDSVYQMSSNQGDSSAGSRDGPQAPS